MILEYSNAIICAAIALRLMLFTRKGSSYRFKYSLLAYLAIVATGANAIYILTGYYTTTYLSEVVVNAIFCIAVFMYKGNVAAFLRGNSNG